MTVNVKQAKVRFNSGKKIGPGQIILLLCVLLFTVFCAAPVLLVFISAFADEMYINQHGFSFFPQVWSMNGMDSVLRYGNQLVQSYLVTIFVLILVSARKKRETQPPESLGLPYFREER